MGLKDLGESLPPGFRFYPSDEELVCHYLRKKITNEEVLKGTLVEIDLHVCEPWQLPDVAKLNSNEWYFFSFRDRKYATGYRTNRATITGYWKATGKDRMVLHPRTREVVGMRKTLVFYRNRAPNGIKTGWIMHEFRLENPNTPPKEDWVLCRVFQKGKGEDNNNNNDNSNNRLNLQINASSNLAAISTPIDDAHNQNLPYTYLQFSPFSENPPYQTLQNPNNLLNFSVIDTDNIQLTQELSEAPCDAIVNPKCEDDQFGFLFDMNFQESSLRDSAPSTLENIRFDEDTSSDFF